jgi:hypothetical protein
MCRGGKDGTIRRCQLNERQHAAVNFRKKVKYRADKAGMSVAEWKEKNPELTEALVKQTFLQAPKNHFQDISETRTLPTGIPESITEHMELSKKHIDSILTEEEKKALSGYTGFAAGSCNAILLKGKIEDDDLYDKAPESWREHTRPPCDFQSREDLIDYLNTMDKVLAERFPEHKTVYRGIPIYKSLQEEFEKASGESIHITDDDAMARGIQAYYQPGKILDFDTYASTTYSAYYAGERTQEDSGTNITYWDKPQIKGIVFEMKTNAGLDVTGVARNHSYEREVILPRNTRFRVENVNVRPDSYDTVSGFDYEDDPTERLEENFRNLAVVVQLVEVDKDGNEITHTNPHEPNPLNLQ